MCYPLCPPDNLQNSRFAETFTMWTSIVGFSKTSPNQNPKIGAQ
jgi:hypothetical protein